MAACAVVTRRVWAHGDRRLSPVQFVGRLTFTPLSGGDPKTFQFRVTVVAEALIWSLSWVPMESSTRLDQGQVNSPSWTALPSPGAPGGAVTNTGPGDLSSLLSLITSVLRGHSLPQPSGRGLCHPPPFWRVWLTNRLASVRKEKLGQQLGTSTYSVRFLAVTPLPAVMLFPFLKA